MSSLTILAMLLIKIINLILGKNKIFTIIKNNSFYVESKGESEIMSDSVGLSLEQQFSLRSFETQVEKMTREQAQDFLVKLYAEMLVRENLYKDTLKHQWGL